MSKKSMSLEEKLAALKNDSELKKLQDEAKLLK
jgi:hypothetical protein